MKLTRQKNKLNFRSSTPKNESQQASQQARNELIDEKMQQYSQLNNFLICADQPKIVRSNSLDNLLEDTFIRRSQRALGNVTSVLGGVINEANSNSRDDYLELQLSRLPKERHNNPELLAQIEMGRMLFKGVTKVGEGISALDDATGNIVSGALRKIDKGAEWLGTHTRRFVRDNLGLDQRVGQNTGDIVKIISGIFVPGTALKALEQTKVIGVAKFKTVLGEKFGLYQNEILAAEKINKGIIGKRGCNFEMKNFDLGAYFKEFKDKQSSRNVCQKINSRVYSGHALDQMQNRGILPCVVENAIETIKPIQSKKRAECREHSDTTNKVKVVVLKNSGKVVAVTYNNKWLVVYKFLICRSRLILA